MKKYFFNILVLLLSLPATFFLLRPGYYNMHDDMQVIRQLEMEKCLLDGQIPCRWTPDLGYGYGYPLFNYYPPLPYLVGQLFRLFNFSMLDSVKLTAALQFILAGQFMYLLVSSLFGPLPGLLSAVLFTYAPYHAVNIYIRGAMNEAWASTFFPLILLFIYRLITKPRISNFFGLAISICLLLLSHNPMVMIFFPVALLWSFYFLFSRAGFKLNNLSKVRNVFLNLVLSAIIGLGFSAFFTLPSILETKLVQIESMFTNYYHFSVHFVSLSQLFISNFWGDGASVWGPNDGMPFKIGYIHWALPILTLLLFIVRLLSTKKPKLASHWPLFLTIEALSLLTIFMTHNRSTFLWQLVPIIQKIQFPWRFLNLVVFLLSLASAWFLFFIDSFKKRWLTVTLTILLTAGTIFINYQHFWPVTSGPITDTQKLSGKSWSNLVTSGIYDYLPKTAQKAPTSAASYFIDSSSPPHSYQIKSGHRGTNWQLFNLVITQNTKLTLASIYFPNILVTDNNQPIPFTIEPEFGRISLNLSQGEHQIFLKYTDTPIRIFSNSLSLFFWAGSLMFIFQRLWTKNKPKN